MDAPGEYHEELPRENEQADQNNNNNNDNNNAPVGEHGDGLMPDDMLPPQDRRRMKLTREEREWARALKEAIESAPDIDNLSDFMYAQIALVEQGNAENAEARARLLQDYRHEYDIMDTFEDARWRLARWIRRLPGHVMHHFYSASHGGYVFVVDLTNMDTSCSNSSEGLKDCLGGSYYMHHTLCPDMDAIRQGATIFAECSGHQWRAPNMADLKICQIFAGQSIASYPYDLHGIEFYNTGTMFNVMIAMSRQCLPTHMKKKLCMGHRSVGSLRDICMVPTVEEATARVLNQMTDVLQERYKNISSFKL